MNRSIQSRLTLALTAAAVVMSAGVGALLYHVISAEMVRNFDRGLHGKGQAIVSLVSFETGGVLDFEFNQAAMPEYHAGKAPEYFQIRFADGQPYSRAESLKEADLSFGERASDDSESFYDLPLPDGRRGRAVRIDFVPQSDQPQPAAKPMTAVIARDRAELDDNLRNLMRSLATATVMLGVATALTSMWIVRRSLRPLRRVALQAATIDASRLDVRLNDHGLPAELLPICRRLNDLLGRLETAFAREKRFTADVAHELRTPIAELRSIMEVTLKWPGDSDNSETAMRDALAISVQMETLVNTLLALVRSSAESSRIAVEPIQLDALVQQVMAGLNATSHGRTVEISIPPLVTVQSDRALLRSILSNLLSNAVEYAADDQSLRCAAEMLNGQWHLSIENRTTDLTLEDLPRMFEPLWRKDTSRTSTQHAGLGLSLVRAYCGLLGIEITATLPSEHVFRIELAFSTSQATVERSEIPIYRE